MPNTVITDLTTESIGVNRGSQEYRVVMGSPSGTILPGQFVVQDNTLNFWILACAASGYENTQIPGVVEYRKRVNESTMALQKIDTGYNTGNAGEATMPIITDGFVVAKCFDVARPCNIGTQFMLATGTSGSIAPLLTGASGIMYTPVATVAKALPSGSLVGIFGIGSCMGARFGGA